MPLIDSLRLTKPMTRIIFEHFLEFKYVILVNAKPCHSQTAWGDTKPLGYEKIGYLR